MKKIKRLPDAELEVMKAVWDNKNPISTTSVKNYLDTTTEKTWNISALQTLLNRLIERGFIKSYKEGKNRYYELLIKQDDYIAVENKSFLEKLNGNSITKFITNLYENKSITNEDLKELSSFIEEKTREE